MQLLVSTGSLPWLPLGERFRLIRQAGADGAELLLTPGLAKRDPLSIVHLAALQNTPIYSVHTTLRLRSPSPDIEASDVIESARFAAALPDCRVLIVHPPVQRGQIGTWLAAIAKATRILGSRVAIGLENLGQHQPTDRPVPFDSLEYLMRFAEEWHLGVVFDTAHAASLGWDILATLQTCLPRLVNIHLSDATDTDWRLGLLNSLLRDHRLPGQGTLPLTSLLHLLRRKGYRGFVTLELSPLRLLSLRPSTVQRRLATAVEFARHGISERAPQRSRPSSGDSAQTN
ncbi:sugar phosphate isomerase/epimerase [Thermomicrobium sp. CFH 73360]|uniref:sugar phosphate isomerase/epimerase family protein n=1 Tax=Thermomicrobium sp. CFH 73360 TaxID=2951987 RepID=UPI00207779BF|nr:sugar phosphate isomerase/epimerase [Thermomicrobium sp. CFH 73360]MCM8747292.1 sugar phosphate isomerase/epimerase [Thermomicrobium sp. CFH 73360]